MPMPQEYQLAEQVFRALLEDVRSELDLPTKNTAYTTVQSVLIVFRRRLTLEQAILFAGVLPALPRAIFVQDWDPQEPLKEFEGLETMNAEVQSRRQFHNFSPDIAIQGVSKVLWRYVDKDAFERVLKDISPEAELFWAERDRGDARIPAVGE